MDTTTYNSNINKILSMNEEIEEIRKFLQKPIPSDTEAIINRGNRLQSYISRLSTLSSRATYYQEQAFIHYAPMSKGEVGSTVMSTYVKSKCNIENRIVNNIERLLKACYCQSDWLRTLVSKAKVEYEAYKNNNNGNFR